MEEKEFDYINVIPLVDVMLVLLTIVLTTSSFIASGMIPMDLPKAIKSSGEMLKTQTIEIDRAGKIYLNSKPVSLEELKTDLGSMNRKVPVLIRADRSYHPAELCQCPGCHQEVWNLHGSVSRPRKGHELPDQGLPDILSGA